MSSQSERKSSSRHVKRSKELMITIKSLLFEWGVITARIHHPSEELSTEIEAFVQILHDTNIPTKNHSGKPIIGLTPQSARLYTKRLDPPPKKITDERKSQQTQEKPRRQTITGEHCPANANSPTKRDINTKLSETLPEEETKSNKKRKTFFHSLSRSKSLQIKRSHPETTKESSKTKTKSKFKKTRGKPTETFGESSAESVDLLSNNDLAQALGDLQSYVPKTKKASKSRAATKEKVVKTSDPASTIPEDSKATKKLSTKDLSLDFDVAGLNTENLSFDVNDLNDLSIPLDSMDDAKNPKHMDKDIGKKQEEQVSPLIVESKSSKKPQKLVDSLDFDLSGLDGGDFSSFAFDPNTNPESGKNDSAAASAPLDFDISGLSGENLCFGFDSNDLSFSSPDKLEGVKSATTEAPTTVETPAAAAAMSYDDFMAALTAGPRTEHKMPSPRGDELIQGLGIREDMNRRGMKKIKKRSITTGRKKGIYQMEDVHFVGYPFENNRDISLLAVFDGHAEKDAAETAKRVFPDLFSEYLQNNSMPEDCSDLLQRLFLDTDEKLLQYETEGTTATSVLIWRIGKQRFIQSANVGDSTAFLCREGKAIALSIDHKVDNPAEIERMKKAGMKLNSGQNRINGLALARTLGDHFIKQKFPGVIADPYCSPVYELNETDTHLILASDGLWDVIDGQQAYEMICNYNDPQEMASKLISYALNSGKCTDNITVIVVTL